MAEYTPTDEQIRAAYCAGSNLRRETLRQHYMGEPATDYGAEFDRWLARVRAEAWDEGAESAWRRSTPEVNGQAYHWRRSGEPYNPYRQEAPDA
ncbi:hypothetical protein [Brachybacterium hainanense]|uniref:Uncharacterized protein n=1 Tax=Brachybacterium hainanense TaxID=1541174 RepID=A0ABV6R956_9MICO